ncbi:hypothetical protein L228DRAFT_271053 [Xylona heveae TC161]|uniref:Anaphase-promoting complex subunit 4 n=1 Tax=Xylona heveae (strain CBS 132557 / TC161) TaxID=1328760 RepID=A0A164ZZ67_XYLHT|nr:hypothetical protein L228DRAFT_271053 [Xylona heveae TC161]KZF19733.1 hypothetical protein L228DRAFT_271053 [Xylona heveae TC161]
MPAVSLHVLAEKSLHQQINPELLAYCPTMDLLAMGAKDGHLNLFRLGGQRVFSYVPKGYSLAIQKLKWKPNGQLLAVAWSDQITRLISSDSGKVVHQLDFSAEGGSHVTCIGWGTNLTDLKAGMGGETKTNRHPLEEVLGEAAKRHMRDLESDLPRELALLDIESSLPKLSILPSAGKDEDIFSSRPSVDAIFHVNDPTAEKSVDVMLLGFDNGTIHIRLYDSFDLGSFEMKKALPSLQICRPVLHASNSCTSTHALLVDTATASNSSQGLYIVPLDLKFISGMGQYLSFIASKSTQLQNLLRYIDQVRVQLQLEWKSSQDLPSRFVRNINETLAEKSQTNIIQAMYHLAVTGNCYPEMKEWLVEILTERGHKRWEKATTSGYENIRKLIHQCLLPALERCNLLVSRLRGFSRYQPSNALFGLSTSELDGVLDTVHCLTLVAHTVLRQAGIELQQFSAFSTWLRHEIDVQASDPSISSADDAVEKDTIIDYARLLEYIQGAMTVSRIGGFFQPHTSHNSQIDVSKKEMLPNAVIAERFSEYNKGIGTEKGLPTFEEITGKLGQQFQHVFKRISATGQRGVVFGRPILLASKYQPTGLDMRMNYEKTDSGEAFVVYVAIEVKITGHSMLQVYRVTLDIEGGVSSTRAVEVSTIKFAAGSIKDAGFVDDEFIMVLFNNEDISHLLMIPYKGQTTHPFRLRYRTVPQETKAEECLASMDSIDFTREAITNCSSHTFDGTDKFSPVRIEINGRKGRRAVCVLDRDLLRYKVFDLDSGGVDELEAAGSEYENEDMMSE